MKENQFTWLINVIDFPQCAPGEGMTVVFMACIGPYNHLILTDL